MLKLKIDVKLNDSKKIIRSLGIDENGRVSVFLRDSVERLSRPFVPGGARGQLAKLVAYPNKHSIKYISPYAHYQYTGILYLTKNGSSFAQKGEKKYPTKTSLKYHVSGTGPKWEKLMLQRKKTKLLKDLKIFLKSGGK